MGGETHAGATTRLHGLGSDGNGLHGYRKGDFRTAATTSLERGERLCSSTQIKVRFSLFHCSSDTWNSTKAWAYRGGGGSLAALEDAAKAAGEATGGLGALALLRALHCATQEVAVGGERRENEESEINAFKIGEREE